MPREVQRAYDPEPELGLQRDRVRLLSDEKQSPIPASAVPRIIVSVYPATTANTVAPTTPATAITSRRPMRFGRSLDRVAGSRTTYSRITHDGETGVRDQAGDRYEREDSDVPAEVIDSEIPREERDGGERQRNRREIASDTEHPAPDQEPLRLG